MEIWGPPLVFLLSTKVIHKSSWWCPFSTIWADLESWDRELSNGAKIVEHRSGQTDVMTGSSSDDLRQVCNPWKALALSFPTAQRSSETELWGATSGGPRKLLDIPSEFCKMSTSQKMTKSAKSNVRRGYLYGEYSTACEGPWIQR